MKLRPYQEEDVAFLSRLKRAACFNQQRTGKTPTVLFVIKNKPKIKKTLIVCTKSGADVWRKHWGTIIGTPVISVQGTRKKREAQIQSWDFGALIITYDALKVTSKSEGFIDAILKHKPDAVIADELHRINGRRTAIAKTMFKLRKIPVRYALTGTPVKGRVYEIWSILHWLYPEQFQYYWPFIREYFVTWELSTQFGVVPQIGGFQPGMEHKLNKIIATFATQRRRSEVMEWLPEKDYQPVYLKPTEFQKKAIKELEEFYETEELEVPNILAALIKIRQICLIPTLAGLTNKESPKLNWLEAYLEENDTSVIVFSKFKKWLQLLHVVLKKYDPQLIVGAMNPEEISIITEQFQAKKTRLLLIQIDVGKEALTLDSADAIVFTDQYPPYGDIEQAEDRFIATTKERADKSHVIYNLILEDTYDSNIAHMLSERANELNIINDFKKHIERNKHGNSSTRNKKKSTKTSL